MVPRSEDPKLINRVINFELVQPICPRYRNVIDGRTDGRTTYDSNVHRAVKNTSNKQSNNFALKLVVNVVGEL